MKKYHAGSTIFSLDVLLDQKVVFVVPWKKCKNITFLWNWQARLLQSWLQRGFFRKAVTNEKIEEVV
jgi:hypothetical protein